MTVRVAVAVAPVLSRTVRPSVWLPLGYPPAVVFQEHRLLPWFSLWRNVSLGLEEKRGRVAAEGLRTIPPRENCGNVDAKQLTKGSRLLIPVNVDGALYSVGDGHFAQGDSECCGTAIEMGATAVVRFRVHRGEAAAKRIVWPRFAHPGYFAPVTKELSDWLPTLEHFPRPKREGGRVAVDNAILAHRLCNRIDFSISDGRSYARDLERIRKAREEAIRRNEE